MNCKDPIITLDSKAVYVEPEIEIVLFTEADLETTFNSQNGFAGEGDGGFVYTP